MKIRTVDGRKPEGFRFKICKIYTFGDEDDRHEEIRFNIVIDETDRVQAYFRRIKEFDGKFFFNFLFEDYDVTEAVEKYRARMGRK